MNKIIEELVKGIPNYKAFMTVEEMDKSSVALREKYPDRVEIQTIGHTDNSNPLYCIKIGDGPKKALFLGCPHPNEPIGAMMVEYLTEVLASRPELVEKLGYTWYFVKCWDIEGTKLNEKWFKGPFSVTNYASNFYRPASNAQVEWTFPVQYKQLNFNDVLPETEAVRQLIDEVKPDFLYSLHNAGFGGVYWYITDDLKDLYPDFYKAASKRKIPLQLGEPEVPYAKQFSDAIYSMTDVEDYYDYLEKFGSEKPEEKIDSGASSASYLKRQNAEAVTLVTELPYFFDKRIVDLSKTSLRRKDVILEKLKYTEKADASIIEGLKDIDTYVDKTCPYYKALDSFTKYRDYTAERNMIESDEKYNDFATTAEVFDNQLVSKFYTLLSYGMYRRVYEKTIETVEGEAYEMVKTGLKKAEDMFDKLSVFLEDQLNYSVIPIRDLIAIQLECGLQLALNSGKKGEI